MRSRDLPAEAGFAFLLGLRMEDAMAGSDLLEQAIDAHGGMDRWRSAREVRVRLSSGGRLFDQRLPKVRRVSGEGHFLTDRPYVEFVGYGSPGRRGVFDHGAVRIEDPRGTVLGPREDGRASFAWFSRRLWWDQLDGLYFRGYTMWNYVAAPFMLAGNGFALREGTPLQQGDEVWRSLVATFPPDIPTHSRQQTFYFDERGWLRRLDYTAEVIYSWATSSNLCYDHKRLSGILVPTRRRVVLRMGGRPLPGPTIVWIKVEEFELIPRPAEQGAKKVGDTG